MFGFFNKKQKSEFEAFIEQNGIEYVAQEFTELILRKLQTIEIAYQFILEEIEAASQGNELAINFAKNSGISQREYKGALSNSKLEVDGPDGPRQTLVRICAQLMSNPDLMVGLRIRIVDNIMRIFIFGKYKNKRDFPKGGMRLKDVEVDILFIVNNDNVVYVNDKVDHLFTMDKHGDEKLDGRVVNFLFSGQSSNDNIEIFVAFDDADSYVMFKLQAEVSEVTERLNCVTQAIFKLRGVLLPFEIYSTKYIWAFHLYQKNEKYFMINNSQTQAYLIDKEGIKRDDVGEIQDIFWRGFN